MKQLIVSLCLGSMLLVGCGIVSSGIHPITDGFHKNLPQQNARIVVWGGYPSSTGTAMTWLQKRGLTIVERARLKQILDEQTIRLTHTQDDEGQILRVGKLLGAETVVFVDSSFNTGATSNFSVNPSGGGGHSTTIYSLSVSIRGVNVETGEVAWTGNARYPRPVVNLDDGLTRLTCNALATAWGLRPTGEYDWKGKSACEIESPASP